MQQPHTRKGLHLGSQFSLRKSREENQNEVIPFKKTGAPEADGREKRATQNIGLEECDML